MRRSQFKDGPGRAAVLGLVAASVAALAGLAAPSAVAAPVAGPLWSQAKAAAVVGWGLGATTVYDPDTHQVILFGGEPIAGQSGDFATDATWAWNATTSSWMLLTPPVRPTPRERASMAFDPATHQMVMFGGLYTDLSIDLTDTWLWRGTTWKPAPTTQHPLAYSVLVYYPPWGELLAVAYDTTTAALRTWRWTGSDWAELTGQTAPATTRPGAITYDPATGQLVAVMNTNLSPETWVLKGTVWVKRTTATQMPAFRGATLAFDPGLNQVVLVGQPYGDVTPQTWQWSGSDWHRMTYPAPPTGLDEHVVYNDAQGQLLMFDVLAGSGPGPWNQTWSLDLVTTTKLSGAPPTAPAGAPVTLTAAVSTSRLAAGLGKVAFYDGAAVITGCAARPVLAGSAQCVATFTTAGQHVIVAKYAGAMGYQPSTGTNLSVRVT